MSSFTPMIINSFKSNFNIKNNEKSNIKTNSELNPNATEFIPEKNSEKMLLIENENEKFDLLEKDFIKNNDWIFYI